MFFSPPEIEASLILLVVCALLFFSGHHIDLSGWNFCDCFSLYWKGLCIDCIVGAKHEVEVESALDENKALEILALYTGIKLQALPEEARSIVKECKGMYPDTN